MRFVQIIVLAAVMLLSAAGFAQPATPAQMAGVKVEPRMSILHMQTKIGSFRLIDGKGRVEFSFTGTVLLSKVKGTVTATGNLRKELDDKNLGKTVYTGTGKITVVGEWRAVQWFGKDMSGYWFGFGAARLVGEFDKDMNTGFFWYDDPTAKQYWFANNVTSVFLPQNEMAGIKPIRRWVKK